MRRIVVVLLAGALALAAQEMRPAPAKAQAVPPPSPKPVVAAGKLPASAPAIDKKAMEQYLRYLELWVPQVKVEIGDPKPSVMPGVFELPVHLSYNTAAKDVVYYLAQDGKHILKGAVYPVGTTPFTSDLKLLRLENQPSFGPPTAPLTISVFSDFQCPLCKEEAQTLRKNIPATFSQDVRVVFLDYPLDAIHPWARPAAIAGRCVYGQNQQAFWSFFDWMYEHQGDIKPDNLKDKVLEWAATESSIDKLKLSQCIETKATEPEVNRSMQEAQVLGIDATPTAFLNGRRVIGQTPWQSLEQIIRIEVEHAKSGGR